MMISCVCRKAVPTKLASTTLLTHRSFIQCKGFSKRGSEILQKPRFASSSSANTTTTRSSSTSILHGTVGQNNRGTFIYGVVGCFAVTVLGGISYMTNEVGGTEGLTRTLSFYSVGIPSYFRYRYLLWRGDDAPIEEWDSLDKEISQKGLDKILELEGFYVKSGQMAASNIGNAFPKIWVDTMSVLQDQCPSKPFSVVKSIIERELSRPINEVFLTIEEEPIGAASIGQVHRATLLNGDKVVVKVMYPNVESLFRGDVRTIKMFCQIAQPVHVPSLTEIEKQFMTEFDYQQEAEQMNQVRQNLINAGLIKDDGSSSFTIPKAYLDLCTKQVLVMEEVKGEKLTVGLQRDMERHAARMGKTPDQLKDEEEMLNKDAREKGILRKGPNTEEFDRYIAFLDVKRKTNNLMNKLNNVFLAWWMPGSSWKAYEDKDALPTNYAALIDKLFYVHGHQILVDGFFNGDPHPGNILLLKNEKSEMQLGLIDYGQVKRLSDEDRHLFCRLIIALADDNRNEIIRLTKEAGYKTKNMTNEIIYKFAKVSYDQDNPEITGGKHIQLFLEELENEDPVTQLPEEFIMVSRVSIILRGLAHHLQQSRSAAQLWKPIAEEVLARES